MPLWAMLHIGYIGRNTSGQNTPQGNALALATDVLIALILFDVNLNTLWTMKPILSV